MVQGQRVLRAQLSLVQRVRLDQRASMVTRAHVVQLEDLDPRESSVARETISLDQVEPQEPRVSQDRNCLTVVQDHADQQDHR